MIKLYNKHFEPVAVVPDHWLSAERSAGDYTRYIIPQVEPLVWDVSRVNDHLRTAPKDVMKTFDITYSVSVHRRMYAILTAGLEHLQQHPDVALYPAGRP